MADRLYDWGPRAYRPGELLADRWLHLVGIGFALIGSAALLVLVALYGDAGAVAAVLPYMVGLNAMFICSAAYNMTKPSARREFLRRFDHAAIFLMIAGTYTPFTTRYLEGAWAIAITAVVWGIAVIGVAVKLAFPRRFERLSIGVYLGLGWILVIPLGQWFDTVEPSTAILIGIGGLLFSVGTVFHLWHRLAYQNAIWHGFVLAAALCHYAAVVRAMAFGLGSGVV
ncbi:PAQR family membrane homeostasis protein TrhA [Zavarzinia compransoris]|uniref:DNA-binding protein n=1 Tax=Zavarzinia compransoris TaxID=1264899 RepID=A0A317E788_9PROT|nr:hemolysin III family protein [Zavarzinia compransoris]PWR22362.1 DNA-binding protein [Zavarzinia compransoris]TDP46870.1 hemolysin III [Zavarzinia compransoris]